MTAKLNIAQRINAAMADVDYIQKEKKSGMNYSIVSHDAVTAKVRPILQKHGVVYYPRDMQVEQSGNRTQAVFTVRFENIDDRSDYIDVATFGYGVDPQDKGPGKAMSYGVKYALLKVLGLETGDDPDEVQDKRADYNPNKPIDQTQCDMLRTLIEASGSNIVAFCKYYGIESLPELPANKFAHAEKSLQTKLAAKGDAA
jgi:hypothetical protein